MADTQQAGCYGKIPAFGDFVTFGKDSKIVSQWREWLHESFTGDAYKKTVRAGWEAGRDGAARWFVYYPPRKAFLSVGLAGVIAPSTDKGGLRPFPFSLFVEVGRLDLRSPLFRHLRALETTWRRIDDVRVDMQGAESLNEALDRVEQRGEIPWNPAALEPTDMESLLRQSDLADLMDPDDEDEEESLERIAAILVELRKFGQLVEQRGLQAAALSLPLYFEVSATAQLSAWMMLLARHRRLGRASCSVFFCGEEDEEGRGAAWLFWRDLTPQDGQAILGIGESSAISVLRGDAGGSEVEHMLDRLGAEPTLRTLATLDLWN